MRKVRWSLWGIGIAYLVLAAVEVLAAGTGRPGAEITTVASGITTDTTTTAVAVPMGPKSFFGQVVCTAGACVQTQAIYGDIDDDDTNGVLLCTLTLTATPADYDACPVVTANFLYYYVVTTATSGTSATGAVYAMY